MKIKATKNPRGELIWFWGILTAVVLLNAGLDLVLGNTVWAAVEAALGVMGFFYWRAERAQMKVDRREATIAAEAMRFASRQPGDITHGEARQQMVEFIKTQRAEARQSEKQRSGADE